MNKRTKPKIMKEFLQELKKAGIKMTAKYCYWHEASDQAAWTVAWEHEGQHSSVMDTGEALAFMRGAVVAAGQLQPAK